MAARRGRGLADGSWLQQQRSLFIVSRCVEDGGLAFGSWWQQQRSLFIVSRCVEDEGLAFRGWLHQQRLAGMGWVGNGRSVRDTTTYAVFGLEKIAF